MSSCSIFCFHYIVLCVAPHLVYYRIFKPCSGDIVVKLLLISLWDFPRIMIVPKSWADIKLALLQASEIGRQYDFQFMAGEPWPRIRVKNCHWSAGPSRSKSLDSLLSHETFPTQVIPSPAMYVSKHSSLLQTQMPHLSEPHGKWRIYFQWPPVKKLVWITIMQTLCQGKIKSCFLDWHPVTLTILILVVMLSCF